MTTTNRPADILRAIADFIEQHELGNDIGSIGRPQWGEADVQLWFPTDETVIKPMMHWARALGVDVVNARKGPRDYHLKLRATLPGGVLIVVTALTDPPETEALDDAAIVGELTLDQLAHFVREPEAVTA